MSIATQTMPCPPHAHQNHFRCAPTLSSLRIPARPAPRLIAVHGSDASYLPHVNYNPCSTPLSPTATISEILPRLYVSDFSCAEDPAQLAAHGITHVLSAMPLTRSPVSCLSRSHMVVPLQDTPFAELAGYLPSTTSFIERALRSNPNARVLVHCQMGASRSVSVTAAYLVASRGMSPAEAVAHIKARRPVAAPNWGFVTQLEEYARALEADAEGSDDEN